VSGWRKPLLRWELAARLPAVKEKGSAPAPDLTEGEMKELPMGYNDAIYTDSDIHLSLTDRLKVLFGWKFTFEIVTYCENTPGRVFSASKVSIWRRWWWQKPVCFVEVNPRPDGGRDG